MRYFRSCETGCHKRPSQNGSKVSKGVCSGVDQGEKEPRHWTLGLGIWFVLSVLAALPAWGAMYVHRNWNDNSIFEMASHTQWHFAVGMISICLLDAILRWWHRWRAPLLWRMLHAAILLTPAVYLSMVAEPWTSLPLANLSSANRSSENRSELKPAKSLSIASWNVFIDNHEYQIIKKTIESLDADIVLLIEVTPEHRSRLRSLDKSYPHSYWALNQHPRARNPESYSGYEISGRGARKIADAHDRSHDAFGRVFR